MRFAFIDNNEGLDAESRKRIRSHAATGKNVGKILARRPRPGNIHQRVKPSDVALTARLKRPGETIPVSISLDSYPVSLPAGSQLLAKRTVSFMASPRHSQQLSNAIVHQQNHTIWVDLLFSDDAYLHKMMAITITALGEAPDAKNETLGLGYHSAKAVYLLGRRLGSENETSNGTMAVVVMMANHDRHQQRYDQARVHLQGLYRMIQMRGGIASLIATEPNLTRKILRVDVEYSLHTGTVPTFRWQDAQLQMAETFWTKLRLVKRKLEISSKGDQRWQRLHKTNEELCEVFLDALSLTKYLNAAMIGSQPKVDGYALHDCIMAVTSRLLHIQPLRMRRLMGQFETIVYLGLSSLIATLLIEFDGKVRCIPFLSEMTRSACQTSFNIEDHSVLLWVMLISSVSVLGPEDDVWLVSAVRNLMRCQNLSTWDDIQRKLDSFPWIDAIHTGSGKALWRKAAGFTHH